jgi:hypothetical protein
MSATSEPAPDDPSVAYQKLLRERDELSRRLNDALGRLAGRDAGAYSLASPGSGPQHDQLVQVFRRLKMQEFRALSEGLYNLLQKKAHGRAAPPADARPQFRHLLAEKILVEGSKWLGILLAVRRTAAAEVDPADLQDKIYESVRQELGRKEPPAEVADRIRETVGKGVSLLWAMRAASPSACLLVPQRGSVFIPDEQEAVLGRPDQGTVHVRFTVFPGYLVTGSNRVLEKALVYTETERSGA